MDPRLLLALAFLAGVVAVLAPAMRERYEAQYGDEEAFFESRYPGAWGLVEGLTGRDGAAESTHERRQCPACGAANGPDFTYCRACNQRLPERE